MSVLFVGKRGFFCGNLLILCSELKFVCTVFVCKFELMGVVSVCKGVFFCGNLLILCSEVVPLEGMQEVGRLVKTSMFGYLGRDFYKWAQNRS
jgi:hypothetical protein